MGQGGWAVLCHRHCSSLRAASCPKEELPWNLWFMFFSWECSGYTAESPCKARGIDTGAVGENSQEAGRVHQYKGAVTVLTAPKLSFNCYRCETIRLFVLQLVPTEATICAHMVEMIWHFAIRRYYNRCYSHRNFLQGLEESGGKILTGIQRQKKDRIWQIIWNTL